MGWVFVWISLLITNSFSSFYSILIATNFWTFLANTGGLLGNYFYTVKSDPNVLIVPPPDDTTLAPKWCFPLYVGLFMGFSVFSFVEIFYFLTIRPYCHYVTTSERRRHALSRIFKRIKNLKPQTKPSYLDTHVEHIESVHDNHIVYPYVG